MGDQINTTIDLAPPESRVTLKVIVAVVGIATAAIVGAFWTRAAADAMIEKKQEPLKRRVERINTKAEQARFYVAHSFDDLEEIREKLGLKKHRRDAVDIDFAHHLEREKRLDLGEDE